MAALALWAVFAQFRSSDSPAISSAPAISPGGAITAPKTKAQLQEEAAHQAKLEALARQEELLRKQEALREAESRAAENRAREKARLAAIEAERRKALLDAKQREDEVRREQQAREERQLSELRERCERSRAAWRRHPQDIPGLHYPCDHWGRYCGSQQTVDEQGRRICR